MGKHEIIVKHIANIKNDEQKHKYQVKTKPLLLSKVFFGPFVQLVSTNTFYEIHGKGTPL